MFSLYSHGILGVVFTEEEEKKMKKRGGRRKDEEKKGEEEEKTKIIRILFEFEFCDTNEDQPNGW